MVAALTGSGDRRVAVRLRRRSRAGDREALEGATQLVRGGVVRWRIWTRALILAWRAERLATTGPGWPRRHRLGSWGDRPCRRGPAGPLRRRQGDRTCRATSRLAVGPVDLYDFHADPAQVTSQSKPDDPVPSMPIFLTAPKDSSQANSAL